MLNIFSLAKKNILITGASSGIGRQCAITCSVMGAKVILLGRNIERLSATLTVMQEPDRHTILAVELTEVSVLEEKLLPLLEQHEEGMHGLIHAAGISTTLPLRMINEEKLQHFFATNVQSGILLTKWLTKKKILASTGASLVFISSVMASVGTAGKTLYSMSKGAQLAAARSMAIELAAKKVRVNCVSPGVVETPMSSKAVYSQNEAAKKEITAKHVLGLGQPEDVAHACVYLLSDAAKWVTGIDLKVDGGYTAQ